MSSGVMRKVSGLVVGTSRKASSTMSTSSTEDNDYDYKVCGRFIARWVGSQPTSYAGRQAGM